MYVCMYVCMYVRGMSLLSVVRVCMCACMYVCMYVRGLSLLSAVRVCVYVRRCMYEYMHTRVCIHADKHITFDEMKEVYTCIHTWHMYVYTHGYIVKHKHTYTHTHTNTCMCMCVHIDT